MSPLNLILCYDLALRDYALAMAKASPCLVVINPNSGPGKHGDLDAYAWQKLAADLAAIWHPLKGVPGKDRFQTLVLGYLDLVTWNGKKWKIKNSVAFANEARRYKDLFQVGGVWLDDCFTSEEGFNELVTSVRYFIPTWKLALNPGEEPQPWAWSRADFVCDYEGNEPDSFTGLPKHWPTHSNAVRIAKGSAKTEPVIRQLAEKQRLAAVCVTDVMDYQRPPTWWKKLNS